MKGAVSDERLAVWAKALSHPARIAILRTLAERSTCICGEIVDVVPLAQSTVSQHLKVLREAGLIVGQADGPRSCYCLDTSSVTELRNELDGLLTHLECRGENCCPTDPKTEGGE